MPALMGRNSATATPSRTGSSTGASRVSSAAPRAISASRLQACRTARRPPGVASRASLVCRADVNWDAFRPSAGAHQTGGQQVQRALRVGAPPLVQQYDFLVIGSGIAGLTYALKVAQHGRVAVITKDYANEGCTQYAQGGVCAVLDANDSVDNHVSDTMVAGAFLNDKKAVEVVCREGPARVLELAQLGAEFTRNADGSLHLTREGGHSHRRIVHAADLTGAEIERALVAAARSHPNITFHEHHLAVDLVTDEAGGVTHCFGVDVLDQHANAMTRFIGLATMLACGGAGQMYPNTTNPHVATGDGIAMAHRAGAAVSNMEFIQFHPTAMYGSAGPDTGGRTFLITEAVRGEGGILLNMAGERFMRSVDRRLELAPRDVVARAINEQMVERGDPHVWLDISHKQRDEVLSHFPNIAAKCAGKGIDITKDPIPVLPAQHYTCGGVSTGLLGDTNIQGLYACGEVACSGLHGANRLASNSLLEGLVFADRAVGPSVAHADYALKHCGRQLHYAGASADFNGSRGARQLSGGTAEWAVKLRGEVRDLMWRSAGIVRRTASLAAAREFLAVAGGDVRAALSAYGVSTELVELSNLVTCAELTVACALQRRESRGLHYSADYPDPLASECRPSIIAAPLHGSRVAAGGGVGSGAGGALLSGPADSAAASVHVGMGAGAAKARRPAAAARDLKVRSAVDKKKWKLGGGGANTAKEV